MYNIFSPDKIHIHERNFKSIIDLEKENKIKIYYFEKHDELKSLFGDYSDVKYLFLKEYDLLKEKNKEELFNFTVSNYSLFSLVKSEMMSLLITKENWYNSKIESEEFFLFNKAFNENKEELLLNMASGLFWFDLWQKELRKLPKFTHCFIFSGSLTYTKVLNFLLQNTPIKTFVLEHFFTGNDFYLEEKYTHIANNSDIKYPNYFNMLRKKYNDKNIELQKKDQIKAVNKFLLSKNKNVKQVKNDNNILFDNNNDILLILGQVINDFSILENNLKNINSLDIYKKIILNVIKNTNKNIIFKAHPWEKNKKNLETSLTKDKLMEFIYSFLTVEEQKRVVIVEDFNIKKLFEISNDIVSICSQSLIEASFYGKKSHQIGNAFYGNKGFTYDYKDEDDFLVSFIKNKNKSFLSIEEYEYFIEFLTLTLENHLISVNSSGKSKIMEKLHINNIVNLLSVHTKDSNIISVTKKDELKLIDIPKTQEDVSDKVNLNTDKNKFVKESYKRIFIKFAVNKLIKGKKLKKFHNNPQSFFNDSKCLLIRIIGRIY